MCCVEGKKITSGERLETDRKRGEKRAKGEIYRQGNGTRQPHNVSDFSASVG